jgi:excisionase family DNA binding protein
MTPKEVAAHFRVDPKTVTRWAKAGRFRRGDVVRTPGGHHRFRRSAVERLEAEGAFIALLATDPPRVHPDSVAAF